MLSNRLLMIANLVAKDAIIADVGSDHALLPIYLVKNGVAKKAYAIDNKKGPISGAIENIANYQLEDKIEVRLRSGIIDLESDVDTVIIAGMGFTTIKSILLANLERAKSLDKIIIQCNNQLDLFREFLYDYKFEIIDEEFINDANKDYNIIVIKYNAKLSSKPSFYISEILLDKKNNDYLAYLKNRLNELNELSKLNPKFIAEHKEIEKLDLMK